jgi:GNAT superfamily N-acetyltransferase
MVTRFSIRRAKEADIPVLSRFAAALARHRVECDTRDHPLSTDVFAAHSGLFRPHICNADSVLVVADGGDELVGYVFATVESGSLAKPSGRTGWIHDLYVVPAERGAGLGGRLLDETVRLLLAIGCPSGVMPSIVPKNEMALTLFRRYGFNPALREMPFRDIPVGCRKTEATAVGWDVLHESQGINDERLNGLSIRECRLDDTEAVLGLWQQAELSQSITDTAVDLRRAVGEGRAVVLIAEDQRRVIGSIIGTFDGWRGNIYRLAVHPDFRRRRVGRALLTEIEKRLAQLGTKRITALVLQDHPWATGFWAAAGYARDDGMLRYVHNLDEK